MKQLGRVGLIGRFKPLHNGGAVMLETICNLADHVIIGIGSSNKYNVRNPFTAEESREMIDLYLKSRFDNYEFLLVSDSGHIPEYSDGRKWAEYVIGHYGTLDHFITGNEYVARLLKDSYDIIHPVSLIPKEKQVYMRGSIVRMAMAVGYDYQPLVPREVSDYLEKNGLVDRFRSEFGLETIAQLSDLSWRFPENFAAEKLHSQETGGAQNGNYR